LIAEAIQRRDAPWFCGEARAANFSGGQKLMRPVGGPPPESRGGGRNPDRSIQEGGRHPISIPAVETPFDTIFDTASRFWVSNGIKWQHGEQAGKGRLPHEITRNHKTARNRKTYFGFSVLCSTN
jgi:hypothetical protein